MLRVDARGVTVKVPLPIEELDVRLGKIREKILIVRRQAQDMIDLLDRGAR